MSYLLSFFSHSQAVQRAAAGLGLQACVHIGDYALQLDDGRRTCRWRAKFMSSVGGRLCYTDQPGPATVGFAGWVPHAPRRWPIATSKSTFKHHAIAHGLPTPAACFDPARIAGPFIIKGARSSFGEGLRGPFLAFDADDPQQQLAPDEYYENFIVGQIAKAWCWGPECVAIHLHAPPLVVGDGRASVRERVLRLPTSRQGDHDWETIARLARYCGVASIDDALADGKEALVDYRYGSRYEPQSFCNANLLAALRGTALGHQFARAAVVCATAIAADPQDTQVVYTLDGIVDSEGRAWFLEVNCNPVVHPDLYAQAMRSTLAREAEAAAGPALSVPDSGVAAARGRRGARRRIRDEPAGKRDGGPG